VNKLSTTEPGGHAPPGSADACASADGDRRCEGCGDGEGRVALGNGVGLLLGVASELPGAGELDIGPASAVPLEPGLGVGRPGTAVPRAVAGTRLLLLA
jgi:hypothetical protein